MNAKSMKSVVADLRQKSPELDRQLKASSKREQLALTLHNLRTKAELTQKQVAAMMARDSMRET
jgi:hypothetical protein